MMKTNILKLTLLIALVTSTAMGCVQKSYQKTVKYTLYVNGINNIQNVGVRGEDNPLSWQKDLPLNVVKADSIYEISVTYNTGYKFAEVKFTVDGKFELQDMPNRRVDFADGDTTFYEASYNNPNN